MKHRHSAPYTRFSLHGAPMIASAVLIGAGSLIGLSGMIVGGTAVMSASRRWFRELQVPVSEVGINQMGQTTAATMAGPNAWPQHNEVQRTRG
jgi:hypothetical protein